MSTSQTDVIVEPGTDSYDAALDTPLGITNPPIDELLARVDYHFVTAEEFQRLIDTDALLEWADIHGGLQRSGTPAAPVREAMEAGRPTLIEVDLAGARAIKAALPQALTVFLAPPSWEALVDRLTGRGTESESVIARRLETATVEMAAQTDFDVVIVNDQLENACAKLVSLLVGR
ncbi:guanylate kinase [Mycobacteroides abscessus subsp. abscessus]|nr:guanylate kinase [Mycobacteroides abscessus subsp. abscessus]